MYPSLRLTAEVTSQTTGAADKAARLLTIRPTRLDYAETAARSRGSGRQEVTLTIGIADLDAKPASEAGPGATVLNLGSTSQAP